MPIATGLLLVRPRHFGYNPENADNTFARPRAQSLAGAVVGRALAEFDALVARLQALGLSLLVLDDDSASPDAIFPNNWFSLLPDGRLMLYPMKAPSRRSEVRPGFAAELRAAGYPVSESVDWSHLAAEGLYLEGTGSLVLDHARQVAYAALSERTDSSLLARWAELTGYRVLSFVPRALPGPKGSSHPIYHTNVLLALGAGFALFCPQALADPTAAASILAELASDREVILLSLEQLLAFAGNMLQIRTPSGPCLLMSRSAHAALSPSQRDTLARYTRLEPLSVPTIEAVGGGSVRCMLGEIGWGEA